MMKAKVFCAVLMSAGLISSVALAKGGKGDAKRGKYLVDIIGCDDCHTPLKMGPMGPEPDMDRFLSGHPEGQPDPAGTLGKTDTMMTGPDLTAWRFQFGTLYSRNLTPDKTGLGDWTEEQFVKSMRTGKHQGDGRALLLPMPWFHFAYMTDEDLKSVWAYLRTIKPIANTVPDPKVPPPVLDQFAKRNEAIAGMIEAQRTGKAPAGPGKSDKAPGKEKAAEKSAK